jgi:hypothetical protein
MLPLFKNGIEIKYNIELFSKSTLVLWDLGSL